MRKTKGYQIWQIVYPIAMYYVVSSIMYYVLELLLGNENETYMLRQMVCAAATIPVVLGYYMQDKKIRDNVYGEKKIKLDAQLCKNVLFAALSCAALGITVNNIIAMTPLIEASSGFTQANEAFFGGQVLYEFLGSCLIIPIAEELLFRGVVYQRINLLLGTIPAIVFSAFIFGLVHVNLVQFLYAAILGLLLAFLYEKTGCFYAPVLGHIAANAIAVVRQETGWLSFSYQPTINGIGFTLVMALIAVLIVGFMIKEYRTSESDADTGTI